MYLRIDSLTQEASSMKLVSGRLNFPPVKFDGKVFYSPAPVEMDICNCLSPLKNEAIGRVEYLKIVNDDPKLAKVMPGALIGIKNIVPNKFLKKVGMAEGYFGEVIINAQLKSTLAKEFSVRVIERNGFNLVVPFGVMDVLKGHFPGNIIDEIIKFDREQLNKIIMDCAKKSSQAFAIMHNRMGVLIHKDAASALSRHNLENFFAFV